MPPSSALEREWQPGSRCPCGECDVVAFKLTLKSGHVKGCSCISCRNRNNRARGQRGEARRHRRLGGVGFTPRDDLASSYSLNVTTEDKVGARVPRKFVQFVESETARHWFAQAEKKTPVGSDALPALYLELSPSRSFLVVKVPKEGLR